MSKDRRRVPRFIIPPGQFWVQSLNLIMATADVSMGGVALRAIDRKAIESFSVGQSIPGELRALGKKFKSALKIVYIRGLTLGCAWESTSPELSDFLKEHFSPAALGGALKTFEVPETAQMQSKMQWWHAPLGADLMFYTHEEETAPYLWALFIHGSVVQWEAAEGLRTGRTVAEDEEQGSSLVVRLETRMVEFDAEIDQSLLDATREFVKAASALKPDLVALMNATIK